MSFIYAHKIISENETIEIYSDTKISFDEIEKKSFESETLNNIKKWGLIKIIIINSQCCIAFAGNNIKLVQELLDDYNQFGDNNVTTLIDLANNIHLHNDINDIEFIICYNDEKNLKHIVCIKNHKKYLDEPSCWIGSNSTFKIMQIEKNDNKKPVAMSFLNAVESGKDDSVGGFVIGLTYSEQLNRFMYFDRFYTTVSRSHTYHHGEQINLFDTAEEGGYTIIITEVNREVHLKIEQINKCIIYGEVAKLEKESDLIKSRYRYFLVPHEERNINDNHIRLNI